MSLLRQAPGQTVNVVKLFAGAALLLALVTGGTIGRTLVRVIIELPLLVVLAAIMALIVNLISAACGSIVGNSRYAAAFVAAIIGWAVSGGGIASFAGLGYNALLQPAFAIALAIPWLFGSLADRR